MRISNGFINNIASNWMSCLMPGDILNSFSFGNIKRWD
jgi:hypothetical protein